MKEYKKIQVRKGMIEEEHEISSSTLKTWWRSVSASKAEYMALSSETTFMVERLLQMAVKPTTSDMSTVAHSNACARETPNWN